MIQSKPLQKQTTGHLSVSISRQRLLNQHIGTHMLETPHAVVSSMGFIQAQDYLGSLWAVGLRMKIATEAAIEQALVDHSIVRTWPSRNTLGYVAAEDVRWILDLLAPRAMIARQGRYRQLELTVADFKSSAKLITDALNKRSRLTRAEFYELLERGGVSTEGQRGIHILSHLALEKLICFGQRVGKQQTFVLFDDWLPATKSKSREEALSELTLRYFSSHGPATAKDFAWWSGLTLADVKAGVASVKSALIEERIADKVYWMPPERAEAGSSTERVVLLPGFDEYLVGYTDRSAVLDPQLSRKVNDQGGMLNPVIVVDGIVAGTWKRTLKKESVEIEPRWFETPSEGDVEDLKSAAKTYGDFLGLTAHLRQVK